VKFSSLFAKSKGYFQHYLTAVALVLAKVFVLLWWNRKVETVQCGDENTTRIACFKNPTMCKSKNLSITMFI